MQLQDSQLPDKLRVDEALDLHSSFYRNPADWQALVDMLGLAPAGRVARGIGALVCYPMMFFAGLWLPIPNKPATLQHISHATPLGAAWESFQNAALGHWPPALALLTMAGYTVVFGLAAARLFRWE